MSKRKLALKVCFVTSSILFGLVVTATSVVSIPKYKSGISDFLGQKDYEIVDTEEGEQQDTEYFKSRYEKLAPLMNDGKALVSEIEGEGATLLKNENNALPLNKGSKISLVGIASSCPALGGRGSANLGVVGGTNVNLKQGLDNAKSSDGTSANFEINEELYNWYRENESKFSVTRNFEVREATWDQLSQGQRDSIATYGDAAIFTVSRISGEGRDMPNGLDESNISNEIHHDVLKLDEKERSILKGLKSLKDAGKVKKIIVLINSAGHFSSFYDDPELGIDAALWIGFPGVSGFNSIGNILAGSLNPSGSLSDTVWKDNSLNPVNKNFGAYVYKGAENFNLPLDSSGQVLDVFKYYDVYEEGIYLGYRYAETRYNDVVTKRAKVGTFDYQNTIAYPFGFGKSYTTFDYKDFNVEDKGNNLELTVTVTNTGDKYSGKEAVEFYVQKPYNNRNIEHGIEVPAVDLIGFEKTKVLAPGESETLKAVVDKRNLTVYDASDAKTYILNDGDYYFTSAHDAHDAINNILAKQGKTKADGMTSEGNSALASKTTYEYDKETYSKGKNTDYPITNLFDDSDITKYAGAHKKNHVTYVSRNDWEGTMPDGHAEVRMSSVLEKDLLAQNDLSSILPDETPYPTYGAENNMKLIELRGTEEHPIEYDDPRWEQFLDQLTFEETATLLSDGQRKTLPLDRLGKPGTLDHNGPAGLTQPYGSGTGLAQKTGDPDSGNHAPSYPCGGILASTLNKDLATKFGDMLGEDALWAGYSGFYGVAINTHRSPYEGRAFEYLSEDPLLAGTMAAHQSAALQAHGCNAYIKHFALNEQETVRQGVGIWLSEQALREIYLRPFELAVVEGGANNAMASFTRIGAQMNPACRNLMTTFLRNECGMKGLVVTDMYDSEYRPDQMPLFVYAGCDIPDGGVTAKVFDKYKEGYGELALRMRESAHHVLYSTVRSNAMNGITATTKIVSITPAWLNIVYVADGILAVYFGATLISALVLGLKAKKKRLGN